MIYRNNSQDDAQKFVSNGGSQYEDIYNAKIQSDGKIFLEVVGKKDLQQEIDSWLEQTDMAYIIRQMQAGTYVGRSGGMYGDFTSMPETMAEAMQVMINAENAFNELDPDIKVKFDNNWRNWLIMANQDTQRYADLMGFVKKEEEKKEEKGSEE